MEYVMNLLAGLGDHFVLIAVGCIEAAVAAVFVGMQLGKNAKSLRKSWRWRARNRFFWKNLRTGRTSAVSSWKMKENCRSTLPEIWRV